MTKTTMNAAVTILSAGMLLTGILAPSAVTGADVLADMKARARTLLPAPSPISAAMSARAVALPLDDFALTTELPSVHFDLASAAIRPADRKVLDTNAEWLRANPGQPIVVEGAADPRGTRDYNLALGERRASAVRDYLVARGVAPDRISILSTGEARPVCRGQDCWTLDRRVDFLVKRLPRQAP